MHQDLHGRVAVVTGGGRGLGLEIATALAEQGAQVLWTAVRNNPAPDEPSVNTRGPHDRRPQEVLVDLLLIGLRSTLLHPRNAAAAPRTANWGSGGRTITNPERDSRSRTTRTADHGR